MEFTTQKELYLKLLPVFNVKKRLNSITKYKDITNENIWKYLTETKWKNSVGLTIDEMINDIITVEIDKINKYITGGK